MRDYILICYEGEYHRAGEVIAEIPIRASGREQAERIGKRILGAYYFIVNEYYSNANE